MGLNGQSFSTYEKTSATFSQCNQISQRLRTNWGNQSVQANETTLCLARAIFECGQKFFGAYESKRLCREKACNIRENFLRLCDGQFTILARGSFAYDMAKKSCKIAKDVEK